MDYGKIGENIQKYRKMKKLSQEKLAEMAGISANYVGQLERGKRIPSVKCLISVANSLEVSSDLLLLGLLDNSFEVIATELTKKMSVLSKESVENIYVALDYMIDKAPKASGSGH